MAITTSSPNNKQYCTLTGTFTGTEITRFYIRINNSSGTSFKWKTKAGQDAWSSETTVTSHSANTAYLITLGMSVTFTRNSLGTYLAGDTWIFDVAPDYRLAPNDTSNSFDRLIPIDKEDEQHLIAINSRSGETAYIENYNSDDPNIIQTSSIPSKETGYVDYVVNNKLAFVGLGRDKSSQVVGYVKNNNWGVSSAEEFEKVQEKSYQQVSISSTAHKVFTDAVQLQGGGASINAPHLSIGFDTEDAESSFYVYNRNTNKVYRRELPGAPLAIRTCPFIQTSGKTTGIAILMESVNGGYVNFFQTYEISDDATVVTFKKSFNLEAPSGNTALERFSDFLIVPRIEDISSNSNIFDLYLAAGATSNTSSVKDGYVFKVEQFKNYNESDFSGSDGGNIEAGDYIPTSPQNSYEAESSVSAHMWVRLDSYNGNVNIIPYKNHPVVIQRSCLTFMGYDANGQNPQIGITVKLKNPTVQEDSSQSDYGGYESAEAHPFWWDGSKYWRFTWVTYVIPRDSSGRNPCHMMAHMKSEGTTGHTQSWSISVLNVDGQPVPSEYPLFSHTASKNSNQKLMCYGESDDGQRVGFYYLSRTEGVCKVRSIKDSASLTSNVSMFPQANATAYTTFNGYSSAYSATLPTNRTEASLPSDEDANRYVLSDREIQTTPANNTALPTTLVNLINKRDSEGDELILQTVGTTSAVANSISSATPWFNINTVTKNTNKDWLGDTTTQQVFYKCALLYDGFQESALIGSPKAFADSGNTFTKGLQVPIEIEEEAITGVQKKISRRITSVLLYRADDGSQNAVEPEGLYRFVQDIPIDNFYLQNNKYNFTVQDDGSRGASYEALNGIPETLGKLGVDYTVNASVNGYMFIGNCNHPEFPDGENIIFRSEPGKYSLFNWSQNFVQLDFIPTAMEGFLGKLYIFGKNQMCIVNPETLIIEENIKGIGCLGPKSMKSTSSGLFWLDYNNVYHSAPKIDKVGTTITEQTTHGWNTLTNAEKDEAVIGYDATRQTLLIFFKKSSDKRCWSYYIPQRRWDLWETDYKILDTVDGDDGSPILLAEEGRIIKMGTATQRRNWEWISKKLTLGTDTNYKKLRVIKMDANSNPSTSLSYTTNDVSSYNSGTDVTSNYGSSWSGKAIKPSSAHSKNRWVRVKATATNGSTTNIKGHSIGIIYKPKKPK